MLKLLHIKRYIYKSIIVYTLNAKLYTGVIVCKNTYSGGHT